MFVAVGMAALGLADETMKADPFSYAEFTEAIAKAKIHHAAAATRRRYSAQCKSKTSATSSRRVCTCQDPRHGQRHVIRGFVAVAHVSGRRQHQHKAAFLDNPIQRAALRCPTAHADVRKGSDPDVPVQRPLNVMYSSPPPSALILPLTHASSRRHNREERTGAMFRCTGFANGGNNRAAAP